IAMGMFGNLSSLSALDVDRIEQGKYLDQAIEESVDEFFQKRMSNPVRKAAVGHWMILYEDDTYVYYGYPKFSHLWLFLSRRNVDELFKVKRSELLMQFPEYEKYQGNDLRLRIFDSIQ